MNEHFHTGLSNTFVFHHTDLPTPTHCVMNQGNSSQYITREAETDDACQEIDKGL